VFVRTGLLAQLHGVTEAARRIHDARLAAGSFHLFRLPEEIEQDLHLLAVELSRSGATIIPVDAAAGMATLEELSTGQGTDEPGPKLLGTLGGEDAWQRAAAVYRDAFAKGFQGLPFFTPA
jgi:hypothetical protein